MKQSLFSLLIGCCLMFAGESSAQPDFEKQPSVHWKFNVNAPVFSSPAISEGVVFFGGLDSILYAIELSTGSLKWKLKTNGEIRSTVSILDNKVYLMGGNGVLSCIDKVSGKPLWRTVFDQTAVFLSERKYDFADYYHSSPLIHNNVIYVCSGNGWMKALDATDGNVRWSFKAGDIIHNKPVVVHDKIFFGSFDGNVYALNSSNGTLIWKFKSVGHQYFPTGEVQGSPAAGFGNIFIGSRDYNFYALDATHGHANWNMKFSAGWALSATVKDTTLYIGTSDDRVLLAVDARNGREIWRTDVKYNIFGGCDFTSGMAYVGTIWGKVYGVNKKTGAIRWAFATDGHTTNKAKYFKADETFRDDIGSILRSPDAMVAAEFAMGGIFSTPAIAGNLMVITTTEGLVYCLKRS